MRLKLGRPNLADYAGFFDAPAAQQGSPLTVTWAGVTTLLIDDGESALMTDGFFSRPSLAEVGLRALSPSAPRIDGSLARLGVQRLEAVLPVHTHFDHAMDTGGGRRAHRRQGGRRNVCGAGRPRARVAGRPPRRRHPGRAPDPRGIRRHADRVRTLPTRPLSRRHHRTRHAAGEGVGVQVRRIVVDAFPPPAVGPAAVGRRQRRLRAAAPWPDIAPTWCTSASGNSACSPSNT